MSTVVLVSTLTCGLLAVLSVGFVVGFLTWMTALVWLGMRMAWDDAKLVATLWALPLGGAAVIGASHPLLWAASLVSPENAPYVPMAVFGAMLMVLTVGLTTLALNKNSFQDWITRKKGRVGEAQVVATVKKLGLKARHGTYVSFDRDVAQIDHIVEVGSSILVIETKNWSGELYGKASDEHWTRKVDDKDTTRVRNPLPQAWRQARILSSATSIEASVLVVLAKGSRVATDRITGVATVSELPGLLENMAEDFPATEESQAAWKSLMDALDRTDQKALARRHSRIFEPEAIVQSNDLPQGLPTGAQVCKKCGRNDRVSFRTRKLPHYTDYLRCGRCGFNTSIVIQAAEPALPIETAPSSLGPPPVSRSPKWQGGMPRVAEASQEELSPR